jgi:hypothetical protein
MRAEPGKYGDKNACTGTWQYPEAGSIYIPKGREIYIANQGRTPNWTDQRAKCAVCKKDCALRADGTIHPHVNTPEARKKRREAVKAAIAHAKTDLLALHTELRTEEP